jgi:DNA-binding MarR family transcriptional regulator
LNLALNAVGLALDATPVSLDVLMRQSPLPADMVFDHVFTLSGIALGFARGLSAPQASGVSSMGSGTKADITTQWRVERPDLEHSVNRLIGVLYRLSQQAEAEFRSLAQSRYGIGAGDLRILLALRRAGACRPTELFQILLITSGAVSKQVSRLCERGLVERRSDPAHKGAVMLQLTQAGRQVADKAIEQVIEESRLARALKRQPDGDVAITVDLLDRLLALVDGR